MDVANKFCGTLIAELLFDVDVNDIVFLITQKFTDWASVTFSKVPPINHLELAPTSLVITGRNEVLAKVIFLHLFVILFTGGGST